MNPYGMDITGTIHHGNSSSNAFTKDACFSLNLVTEVTSSIDVSPIISCAKVAGDDGFMRFAAKISRVRFILGIFVNCIGCI